MKLFTAIGAFLHGACHFFDAPPGFTDEDREFSKIYDDLFDGALALGLQPGPKESPYVVMIDLDVFLFLYFEEDKKRTTTYVEYKDLANNNLWKGYRDDKGGGGYGGMTTKEKLLDIVKCLKEVKRKMDGLPAEIERIEARDLVKRFLDHYGIGSLTIFDGQYTYESSFREFEGIKVDVMVQVEASFNPPSNHYLDIRVFKDSDPRHRLARFNWKFCSEGNIRGILDPYGFVVEEVTKLDIEQLKEVFDLKQLREEGETVADHVESKLVNGGELKAAIKRIQKATISPDRIQEEEFGNVVYANYKDVIYKVGTGGHRNGAQTPDIFIVMGDRVVGRCFINKDGAAQLQDVVEAFHTPIKDFAAIINAAVDQNQMRRPIAALENGELIAHENFAGDRTHLAKAIANFYVSRYAISTLCRKGEKVFLKVWFEGYLCEVSYGETLPNSQGPIILVTQENGVELARCRLAHGGQAYYKPSSGFLNLDRLVELINKTIADNNPVGRETGFNLEEAVKATELVGSAEADKEPESAVDDPAVKYGSEPPFIDMDFIDLSDVWVEWYSLTHGRTTVEAVRVGMRKLTRFHEQLTARLASVKKDDQQ